MLFQDDLSPAPWVSDQGDGTYCNPVLFADYSDPDVIRVGEWFYMTASSFNCTPGLPVLRSADMVNWELIGHALRNLPDRRYEECQPGCGVWAPAIRFHGGRFYIVYPTPDEGLFVVSSEHPDRRWTQPQLLLGGQGLIDPCPFWDDDGKAYVIHGFAYSRAGIKSKLRLIEVKPDLTEVLDEGTMVVDAMGRIRTLEGPKMLKREGYYYISAPAGGVPMGVQMLFRSRDIRGPYEEKVLLEQGGTPTNGPHQGSLLDDTAGDWWFIHFQDLQPWGRIVHLQPVRWEKGWPLMGMDQNAGDVGRPVFSHRKPAGQGPVLQPADSDRFEGPELGLQWQWNANHREDWHRLTQEGLELKGASFTEDFSLYPRVLSQKINSPRFGARVTLSFQPQQEGQEAGISMMGLESFRLGIRLEEGRLELVYTAGEERLYSCSVEHPEQTLFLEMNPGALCRFGRMEGLEKVYLGPAFHAKQGRWIGARFGLFCLDNTGTEKTALFKSVEINQ